MNHSILDYHQERQSLSRDGFQRRFDRPVLLHRIQEIITAQPSFLTSLIPRPRVRVVPLRDLHVPRLIAAMGMQESANAQMLVVYPLNKRLGGAFQERITIGRARTADIHLPFQDVSKLHAYFERVPGTPPEAMRFALCDAGSRNGTFLGDQQLLQGKLTEVTDGAQVQIGPRFFLYYTPGALYDLLSRS